MTPLTTRIRLFIVGALAVVGALGLIGSLVRFTMVKLDALPANVVIGPDGKPMAGVPVFLDRGGDGIERYVTDSAGAFSFALSDAENHYAVWLICARGGMPMVIRRNEDSRESYVYHYTKTSDSTFNSYKAFGWRGPIPRECPKATDSMGWRYPASAGKPKDAITFTEPDWSKQ